MYYYPVTVYPSSSPAQQLTTTQQHPSYHLLQQQQQMLLQPQQQVVGYHHQQQQQQVAGLEAVAAGQITTLGAGQVTGLGGGHITSLGAGQVTSLDALLAANTSIPVNRFPTDYNQNHRETQYGKTMISRVTSSNNNSNNHVTTTHALSNKSGTKYEKSSSPPCPPTQSSYSTTSERTSSITASNGLPDAGGSLHTDGTGSSSADSISSTPEPGGAGSLSAAMNIPLSAAYGGSPPLFGGGLSSSNASSPPLMFSTPSPTSSTSIFSGSGSGSGGARAFGKHKNKNFIDVFNQRPFRLTVKVQIPVHEHPKFNFVGKLLGPKGNSLKRLQDRTQTRMAIFGRGSMKTRQQEQALLDTGETKYKHLEEDLHVEISTYGPPVEVYGRISTALQEIRQYLVPDKNDNIRQQQRIELLNLDPISGEEIKEGDELGGEDTTEPEEPVLEDQQQQQQQQEN